MTAGEGGTPMTGARPGRGRALVAAACLSLLLACGGSGGGEAESGGGGDVGAEGSPPRSTSLASSGTSGVEGYPDSLAVARAAAAVVHPPLHAIRGRPTSGPLPPRFGVGRPASAAEITALDIDVGPDGEGLPPGRGSVEEGERIYGAQCVACHGPDLRGTPAGDPLVPDPANPGFPDGEVQSGQKTLGNYWPWAPTIFDYVRRSMPQDRPGSLSDDEVYAVTAYLLWRNGIVDEGAVLDATTLPAVRMPARDRFVVDDRPASERVR